MNILFVENNFETATKILHELAKTKYRIHRALDRNSALRAALTPDYQILILDIESSESCQFGLLAELNEQEIRTPLLILSNPDCVEGILPYLNSTTVDFLVKPFEVIELRARIKALQKRTSGLLDRSRLMVSGVILDLIKREAYREEKTIQLQNNEYELLKFLMRNSGRVITKAQILQKIWDYNFDPQTNIVDVLVWRLREKIDKEFSKKLIQTVRGVGYTFQMG